MVSEYTFSLRTISINNLLYGYQAEEEPEFQFTDDQIAEIRDAFNMYDREKKGEIPTAILGTVMKNLGHNLKPDQLAECIDAVDGDGM